MEVKILGTRGEIEHSAPYHSHHSGVLIDQELLLDLGEEEFLEYEPRWILITHLHPDHAFFVDQNFKELSINPPIYAPEKYPDLKIRVVKPEQPLNLDGFKARAIPTTHSKKVENLAYLIQRKTKKVLYTGDLVWLEKKYHHYFDNLDLVITDGSFIREGGIVRRGTEGELWGHTGIPNLVRLFKDHTDKILFIHYGSWFYTKEAKKARKKITQLGEKNNVQTIVGHDGQKLKI